METAPGSADDARASARADRTATVRRWMAFGPPERFAARYGHHFGAYVMHEFEYDDAEVAAYARRVGEILADRALLDRVRREHLSPAEREEIAGELRDADQLRFG